MSHVGGRIFPRWRGRRGLLLLLLVGLLLIPRINHASDHQDAARFQTLHRLDIALVAAGMVIGLLLIVALAYVLPGHFTFWQH